MTTASTAPCCPAVYFPEDCSQTLNACPVCFGDSTGGGGGASGVVGVGATVGTVVSMGVGTICAATVGAAATSGATPTAFGDLPGNAAVPAALAPGATLGGSVSVVSGAGAAAAVGRGFSFDAGFVSVATSFGAGAGAGAASLLPHAPSEESATKPMTPLRYPERRSAANNIHEP